MNDADANDVEANDATFLCLARKKPVLVFYDKFKKMRMKITEQNYKCVTEKLMGTENCFNAF